MLKDNIKQDMMTAMKARDQVKLDTLRGALSAFTNELVDKGMKPTDDVSDDMAFSVLKRLAKQRQDSIEQFTKGGRPELAEKESQELAILKAYLPQMATRGEIEKVARAKKEELGIADASGIGKLTGAVMKEFSGRADGNDVREVLQSIFA